MCQNKCIQKMDYKIVFQSQKNDHKQGFFLDENNIVIG